MHAIHSSLNSSEGINLYLHINLHSRGDEYLPQPKGMNLYPHLRRWIFALIWGDEPLHSSEGMNLYPHLRRWIFTLIRGDESLPSFEWMNLYPYLGDKSSLSSEGMKLYPNLRGWTFTLTWGRWNLTLIRGRWNLTLIRGGWIFRGCSNTFLLHPHYLLLFPYTLTLILHRSRTYPPHPPRGIIIYFNGSLPSSDLLPAILVGN